MSPFVLKDAPRAQILSVDPMADAELPANILQFDLRPPMIVIGPVCP